jgi:O-antigen ligase/tetratricopeptide (TPR) repeat protein
MSNILLKLIKFGIGLVLFIPLYIGGSFFFPFIFPKIWLFQLVVEIIFFFYVLLALLDARYRSKWNLITGAVILLTIILIITSLTGIDAFRSFWGNTERMSGVIAWFHFVAFALILSGILKTEKEWRSFFKIAVAVSVLEFFYVLAQYLNASFVWLPGNQFGTIGNTDLLGTYAIFSAFFSLYLWKENQNINILKYRWFWITAFFLNIATLFIASSRGAILGFGVGIFAYILFLIWREPEKRKVLGIGILIIAILYSSLWLMKNKSFIKNNRQLSRITNISLNDDTVQQRFTEWGIAWSAFKARPIFGFGPNNYLYLHNLFLNPRVYNLRETNFDRAHDAYLDYASMSGIFGLLGYLFLIGTLFWVFWKSKLWTWMSLVVAYAVQSFFVFDSPASYITLFLTIGFASYVAGNHKSQIPISKQITNPKNLKPQTIAAISIFYFIVSIFLIWQVSIKPASANLAFTRAFSGISTGAVSPQEAFDSYRDSLKYETLGSTEFRNQYVQWLQHNLGKFKPEDQLGVLDFGISELEKEVRDHPLVFSYLNLGQLYYFEAGGISNPTLRPELYQKTAAAYDKALELSPNRLEVYYSYLQWSFDNKNYSKGVELMKRAVEINPSYPQNPWYLGLAYISAGDDKDAVDAINKSLTLWYRGDVNIENNRLRYNLDDFLKVKRPFAPKQEILGAVNPYIRLKMWPELLLLYLSAGSADPNDINIHKSLALVYQNLGLADKANEELKIIDSLEKK